ncbi:tyrosine-type recombinase/integrase [Streptomyces sp. NPDC046332]|uniref:tyrosine-type recombinase/integrase n=1 Tax=Streptomyces sp. NPDC046332 TaxID=3155133 RepID=UPI0033D535F7
MPDQGRRPLRRPGAARPHRGRGVRRGRRHPTAPSGARPPRRLHHSPIRRAGLSPPSGSRSDPVRGPGPPCPVRAAERHAGRQGPEVRRRRPAGRLPGRTRPRARSPPGALRWCRSGRHLFRGPRGGLLRRTNFRDDWTAARTKAGVSGDVHFHDLRHTGNTLASSAGASTRELMTRMGHSTTRAALIHQHMTSDRDQHIAGKLGEMIRQARKDGPSGT